MQLPHWTCWFIFCLFFPSTAINKHLLISVVLLWCNAGLVRTSFSLFSQLIHFIDAVMRCSLHKSRVAADWKSFGSGKEEGKHRGRPSTDLTILLLKVVDLHLCLFAWAFTLQEESRLVRLWQRRQRLAGGQHGAPTRHQTCSQIGSVGGAEETTVLQLEMEEERGRIEYR